jgi:predicted membrane protein
VSDENKFDPQKLAEELRDQIHGKIRDRMTGRRPSMVVGIRLGSRPYGGGLIWGVLLTLFGVALLLDHLGIISFDRLWRFWPLVLIFAGAVNFRSPERRFWGIILLFAGVILQFNQLGLSHFGWGDFWPFLLIGAGLLLMWNALDARKRRAEVSPAGSDPRTTLNEAVVFGGLERRMTSQDFQGGDVTAIFGGVELDLTEANMQANEAILAITAIFGGVEVRVPSSWQVAYRGSPIFGGVEDKTRTARVDDPANPNPKTLVITGAVIFGGLEIKN